MKSVLYSGLLILGLSTASLEGQIRLELNNLQRDVAAYNKLTEIQNVNRTIMRESISFVRDAFQNRLTESQQKDLALLVMSEKEWEQTQICSAAIKWFQKKEYRKAEAEFKKLPWSYWRLFRLSEVYVELAKQPQKMESALKDFWLIDNAPGDNEASLKGYYHNILIHYAKQDDRRNFTKALELMRKYYMVSKREEKKLRGEFDKLKSWQPPKRQTADFVENRYARTHLQQPTYPLTFFDLTTENWFAGFRKAVSATHLSSVQRRKSLDIARKAAIKKREYHKELHELYRWSFLAIAELDLGERQAARKTAANISKHPADYLLIDKRFQYNDRLLAYVLIKTGVLDTRALLKKIHEKRITKQQGLVWLHGACAALVEDGNAQAARQLLATFKHNPDARIHARSGILCGLLALKTSR